MIKRIKVTSDHIEEGVPKSCPHCPLALAIAEVATEATSVRVFHDSVSFWVGTCYPNPEATLPPVATRFICAFDNLLPVTPFEFDMDIPEAVLPEES